MHEALAALDKNPERAFFTVAFALVAIAVGIGIYQGSMFQQKRKVAACIAEQPPMGGIWNPQAKEDVRRSFLATHLPYAETVLARAESTLDSHSRSWETTLANACAAHVIGAEPEKLAQTRMCLLEQSTEIAPLVALFRTANTQVVQQSVDAVDAIENVSRCLKRAPERDPSQALLSPAGREIHEKLAEAKAAYYVRRFDASIESAKRAQELAQTVSDHVLEARATLVLGTAQGTKLEPAAKSTLLDAAFALEETHQDGLCARAWLELVDVRQNSVEETQRYARHAKAAVGRVGEDPALRIALHLGLYRANTQAGQWDEAARSAHDAATLATATYGPTYPVVGSALLMMGSAEEFANRFADARVHIDQAASIYESNFGPGHPRSHSVLRILASLETATGNHEESIALYRRLLSMEERTIGKSNGHYSFDLLHLGFPMEKLGRFDEALRMGRESLAIRERIYGLENADTAYARAFVGEMLGRMGDTVNALEQLKTSLGIFQRTRSPTHSSAAGMHLAIARVYLQQNNLKDARTFAERVIELRTGVGSERELLAGGQFVLAQVLWNSRVTRPRALELAREAHEGFEKLGKGFQRELNDVVEWEKRVGASTKREGATARL